MRIYGLILCLIIGFPGLAASQTTTALSHYTSSVKADLQQALEKASQQAEKSDAYAHSKRAGNSLLDLQKAYPEQGELVAAIWGTHGALVRLLAKKEFPAATVKQQLALLYRNFVELKQIQPEVAAQVKAMLNHRYWLEGKNRSVNLAEVFILVQPSCTGQTCQTEERAWFVQLRAQ